MGTEQNDRDQHNSKGQEMLANALLRQTRTRDAGLLGLIPNPKTPQIELPNDKANTTSTVSKE